MSENEFVSGRRSGSSIEGTITGLRWCNDHAFEMGPDLYPCPECRVQELRHEARNEALEEAVQALNDVWERGTEQGPTYAPAYQAGVAASQNVVGKLKEEE